MRRALLFAAALSAGLSSPAAAQRGRRADTAGVRRDSPASTSDTRFTPALKAGQRLSVSNIDGNVTVMQGQGQSAEIVVHKLVRKGNGNLVKAVLEETSNGYRVCTVYLGSSSDERGCTGGSRGDTHENWREPLDVEMKYDIRLPAGVALSVNSVDGSIEARGIDTPATLRSVDGSITFEGVAPDMLNTVDGAITATITNTEWSHPLAVRSVDGGIDLTLPAAINMRITGHTVDGGIESDFPMTISGKWGPQSFQGDVGNGSGPSLELSSVDGGIRLRSSDGVRRGAAQAEPARRRGRGRP